jgi:hemin uptake protein HemP
MKKVARMKTNPSDASATSKSKWQQVIDTDDDARKLFPSAKNVFSSGALLNGQSSITIIHGEHRYTLHETAQGKLILTK